MTSSRLQLFLLSRNSLACNFLKEACQLQTILAVTSSFKAQAFCAGLCIDMRSTAISTIVGAVQIVVDIITKPIPNILIAASAIGSSRRCCSSTTSSTSYFKAQAFIAIICINIRSTAISSIKQAGFIVVLIITAAIPMPIRNLTTLNQ